MRAAVPAHHTEQMPPGQPAPSSAAARQFARLMLAAVALGFFAAAMWGAWLGWDQEYYQVDGVPHGPYRAWQVLGCALSIAAAAIFAYLRVPGIRSVFVLTAASVIGFAVPWTVHAAITDDSGLWIVGALFLLVGGGVGMLILLTLTAVTTTRRPPRSPTAPTAG